MFIYTVQKMKDRQELIPQPLVSVIMPAYNAEPYIAEAIVSILHQTYAHFELLIADDASTDQTLSVIRSYQDPRIRVLQHTQNLGYVGNMNTLFRAAKGDFIMIQDADDYCEPNRLSCLYEFFQENSHVDLVGSSYYKVESNGQQELVVMPTDIALIKAQFDQMHYPLPIVNGCCMLRRKIIEQGFSFRNLKYVSRGQDDDWLFRLSEHVVMANVPEALYYYRTNQASMTLNPSHTVDHNVWAADFVKLLKQYRMTKNVDLLSHDRAPEIDAFFNAKREEVLRDMPAFFELYHAEKYLGVNDRKNALIWYAKALRKDVTNAYIWKKMVWVLCRK
jgi:glycosyltransferase involved in cell wall biosynthesis